MTDHNVNELAGALQGMAADPYEWQVHKAPLLREAAERLLAMSADIASLTAKLDDDPRHIIQFAEDGWTIAHPLVERLNLDTLFDCQMRWADEDPGVQGRFYLNAGGSIGPAYQAQ